MDSEGEAEMDDSDLKSDCSSNSSGSPVVIHTEESASTTNLKNINDDNDSNDKEEVSKNLSETDAEIDSVDLCAICLDQLPDAGQKIARETRTTQYLARIRPCSHLYHDFCIQAWAEKANTCPKCRGRFNTIELIADHKVTRKIHVDDKLFPLEVDDSIPPEFVDELEDLPEFHHQHLQNQLCCLCDCTTNSPFVICSECSSGYHLSCLGISEFTRFNCPICDSIQDLNSVVAMDRSSSSSSSTRANRRQRRIISGNRRAVRRANNNSLMQQLRQHIRSRRFNQLGLPIPVRQNVNSELIKRRAGLNSADDDIDYVSLADSNRKRAESLHLKEYVAKEENQKENSEEKLAWKILDNLRNGTSEPQTSSKDENHSNDNEKKLKRPKHRKLSVHEEDSKSTETEIKAEKLKQDVPAKLTVEALNKHDKELEQQEIHNAALQRLRRKRRNTPQTGKLNYNEKMIVQRILLRPYLRKLKLPAAKYTEVNKFVSRHLYKEIESNPQYLYRFNALHEIAEREGVDFKNKKAVDEAFSKQGIDHSLEAEFGPIVRRLIKAKMD